jgi:hypothetical protein
LARSFSTRADLRGGQTMSDTNRQEPRAKIGRAIQDQIGRELRAMYEELLRQPLPEHLVAPLRAPDDVQTAAKRAAEDMQPTGGTTPRRAGRARAARASLPAVKQA